MLVAFIYLLIVPLIVGMCIGIKRGLAELYLSGFLLMFGVFSVCYYVVIFLLHSTSMVMMARLFQIALIPFFLGGGIRFVKEREEVRLKLQDGLHCFQSERVWVVLAIALIAFQVVRVGVYEPFAFSDSQTYDALVNDMAQSGVIYGQDPRLGQPLQSLADVDARYIITSWYVYEAYMVRIAGVTTVLVTEIVLPMVILFLSYVVLWILSGVVFANQMDRRWLFLFLCGIIAEAQLVVQDAAGYMLVWPTWGKNLIASIICPVIAVLFMECVLQRRGVLYTTIALMLCSFLASNISAAGMMAVPIELGALCLAFAIAKRRPSLIVVGAFAVVPIGVEFILYKLFAAGLLFA